MHRALVLSLVLTACNAASVSGTVDGEPVKGARNAIFDEADVTIPLLGTQKLMLVIVTDLPNACDTYTQLANNVEFTCDESCEDLGRIAQEELGADDYWTLDLVFNADPTRVEGSFAYAGLPGTSQFNGTFARWDTAHLYDEATCMQTCQDRGALPSLTSSVASGSAEVSKYSSADTLAGTFDVMVDGDPLDGSFNAKHCPNLSDYVLFLPE